MWKFFRDLLKSNETNPSLVRWSNKWRNELVFEIVEPKIVAQMWHEKKGTKTKEKRLIDTLARGMR